MNHWYSIAALVASLVLALFGCGGIALLFRRPPQAVRYVPVSVSAPLGYVSLWNADTQEMGTPTVKMVRMPQAARGSHGR